MLRLLLVMVLSSALLAGPPGCAGEAGTAQPPADSQVRQSATRLLEGWNAQLLPALELLGQRRLALQQGQRARLAQLDARLPSRLAPLTRWGRQARKAFLDAPPSALTRATVRAGDAWAQWALLLLGDQQRSYQDGVRLADLAAAALRHTRRAFTLAGQPIPPALQTSAERGP